MRVVAVQDERQRLARAVDQRHYHLTVAHLRTVMRARTAIRKRLRGLQVERAHHLQTGSLQPRGNHFQRLLAGQIQRKKGCRVHHTGISLSLLRRFAKRIYPHSRISNSAYAVSRRFADDILPPLRYHTRMKRRILIPLAAGLTGSALLTGIYFGILSWAQGFQYAASLFWQDRWIVFPIIIGFGVQAALYSILRFRPFVPVHSTAAPAALTGASGATSSMAMVACCIHHVTDVLPILGLTAAATFLARYRIPFMLVGLGMNLFGIAFMSYTLYRERQKILQPGDSHA